MPLNINEVRKDFPIFQRETKPGVPLVYLDSTATSQKPLAVIEAMDQFYRRSNANIHRGVHTLAEESTAMYEQARVKIAKFINAPSAHQIIYTRNTTESINLVAYSWGRANLKAGDLVILTELEHHSNLVPWHMLQAERGIELDFIPVTEDGLLDLEVYKALLPRPETGLVCAYVQRPRNDQSRGRDHPPGSRSWRGDAGRCGPIGSTSESGRAGPRRRFSGVFRPQNVWTHGHRRAVWKDGFA